MGEHGGPRRPRRRQPRRRRPVQRRAGNDHVRPANPVMAIGHHHVELAQIHPRVLDLHHTAPPPAQGRPHRTAGPAAGNHQRLVRHRKPHGGQRYRPHPRRHEPPRRPRHQSIQPRLQPGRLGQSHRLRLQPREALAQNNTLHARLLHTPEPPRQLHRVHRAVSNSGIFLTSLRCSTKGPLRTSIAPRVLHFSHAAHPAFPVSRAGSWSCRSRLTPRNTVAMGASENESLFK